MRVRISPGLSLVLEMRDTFHRRTQGLSEDLRGSFSEGVENPETPQVDSAPGGSDCSGKEHLGGQFKSSLK